MTAFFAIAAGLIAVVSALILVPLMRAKGAQPRAEFDLGVYRDQLKEIERDLERGTVTPAEAETARTEIHRRMLAAAESGAERTATDGKGSRRAALAAVALIPLAAAAFYMTIGAPGMPDVPYASRTQEIAAAKAREGNNALRSAVPNVDAMLANLAERLKREPDDLEGWLMLGRSYMAIERFADAADAFSNASKLSGERADILTAYAEALIFAHGMTVSADVVKIAESALAKDPVDIKARYYRGLGKAQAGDVKGALQDWIDVRRISAPDAPWMGVVNQQIAAAAGELKVDPKTVPPSPGMDALAAKLAKEAPPAPRIDAPAAAPPGPSQADVNAAAQMSDAERQAFVRSMVERLAERLKENPNDPEGWQRLARAYDVLGEKDKAEDARRRAQTAKKP